MFRRVALLLACSAVAAACGSRPNRTRDAAIATGAAVAAAGVYRATTGGCWAACPPGRYCNSATGTCDEFPQGSPPVAAAAAAPEANDWWRAGDAACPEGAALDEDEPVILCTRPDGTPHGPATFFYSNGRRESEGEYRDGKPIGVWRHWDEDGHPTKTEDLGGQ